MKVTLVPSYYTHTIVGKYIEKLGFGTMSVWEEIHLEGHLPFHIVQ